MERVQLWRAQKRALHSVLAVAILQSIQWPTMSNLLGFRSVAAGLTSLAENGVHDFDEAIYTMSHHRKELYAISEEEEREKPLKVNVRRAYRIELDRLFQLALSVPELQASNQRVFMNKGEFNRWLFMNTVTLVAERRGRILDFLSDAGGNFRPDRASRRSSGVPAAGDRSGPAPRTQGPHPSRGSLYRRLRLARQPGHPLPRKIGYLPGKQYLWMDHYA